MSGDDQAAARPGWSVGSTWLRWDPHIHAPGTLLNDQFNGDWPSYLDRIERADPQVVALGVTDYCSLGSYKAVRQQKDLGRLPGVALIFANIEFRLTIETAKRRAIILHLLVDPTDAEHVQMMEEKLARITFSAPDGQDYQCTDASLVRLGRAHRRDPALAEDAARREGANQFKVELGELRDLVQDSWFRSNVLIAIAGGNDGPSALSPDASFAMLKEGLFEFADIVFSGNPTDRAFWGERKLCLHGCDAHDLEKVLEPAERRLCWLRGTPTFDSARQALLEPLRRVHIGPEPPPTTGDRILSITLSGAPWIENEELILNDGLVTVIGAKGSGKTALADLIASAAGAEDDEPGPASFVEKAGPLLTGLKMEMTWADGTLSEVQFPRGDRATQPRVRYLSQQFVERLCAPSGLSDPLADEIEAVVFSAIPEEEKALCADFAELREHHLRLPEIQLSTEREAISEATQEIAALNAQQKTIPSLKAKLEEGRRQVAAIEKEVAQLPVPKLEGAAETRTRLVGAITRVKEAIAAEERTIQGIREVAAEVDRLVRQAQTAVAAVKGRHATVLPETVWAQLIPRVEPAGLAELSRIEGAARGRVIALRERGLLTGAGSAVTAQSQVVAGGLAALTEQLTELDKALGLSAVVAKRRDDLEKRLAEAKRSATQLAAQLEAAGKAAERRVQAQDRRLERYGDLFGLFAEEDSVLQELYSPLREQIERDGRLAKLSFHVQRIVDVQTWAERGESLFDLRKPPFQGKGVLLAASRQILEPAWTTGDGPAAAAAMKRFIEEFGTSMVGALLQGDLLALGDWLFSTDHIQVRYALRYEGVDLANLSPGTKGVVLLTLYLALDQWDARPLVIDQPEENLDPRSIFNSLVPFFRDAAARRQIIMVTHNANLVVNGDSDQVVVAEATRSGPAGLPRISYAAGGLEEPWIRGRVCELLEGGEAAFKKRWERYGHRGSNRLST